MAFPNIGKFTATLEADGVEIMLITPDPGILEAGDTGNIKLTFKNVNDFDTLSFEVISSEINKLELTDITFAQGPLTISNTNIIIGENRATLNYVAEHIDDVNIDEKTPQTLYLHFKNPSSPSQFQGDNYKLSNLILKNILFGDPNGDTIASFQSISEEDASTVAPTVVINSPTNGDTFSSEEDSMDIYFEITVSEGTLKVLLNKKDVTFLFEEYKPTISVATISVATGEWSLSVTVTDNEGSTNEVSTNEEAEFSIVKETTTTSEEGVAPQPIPEEEAEDEVPSEGEIENLAPDAIIRSPTNGQVFYVGKAITFDATSSTDLDGKIEEANWAITHYKTSKGVSITEKELEDNNLKFSKSLAEAGKYIVEIELIDNDGGSASARAEIEIISIGDINGDGRITGADVTASEWLSVGVNHGYNTSNADANQDESTDSLDISAIEKIVLE
jgi:hypothetical protein